MIKEYTKEELLALLKRHTNTTDGKCDCNCPYTGNSVMMVINFVVIYNELPDELVAIAEGYFKQFTETQCYGGNRLVLAASLLYLAGRKYCDDKVKMKKELKISQREIADLFFVHCVSVRKCSREISEHIPDFRIKNEHNSKYYYYSRNKVLVLDKEAP